MPLGRTHCAPRQVPKPHSAATPRDLRAERATLLGPSQGHSRVGTRCSPRRTPPRIGRQTRTWKCVPSRACPSASLVPPRHGVFWLGGARCAVTGPRCRSVTYAGRKGASPTRGCRWAPRALGRPIRCWCPNNPEMKSGGVT